MEYIVTLVTLMIFAGLLISPILLLLYIYQANIKNKFSTYLIIGIFTTAILIFVFSWWNYQSTIILLKHYQAYIYNPDSDGYQVDYKIVLPKNIEKVKNLEREHMGIGWPLKAIFVFIFYLPYLLIVYAFKNFFLRKIKAS